MPTTGRTSKRSSGDIAAAVGLKNTTTGDTLCDDNHPIILESMEFPDPVIRVAIEPKTKAGQEKMGLALVKLAEEDPTFRTWTDEETGQTIIAGMGELHLEIIVDRLPRRVQGGGQRGRTPGRLQGDHIKKSVEQDTKYARQSGGRASTATSASPWSPMSPARAMSSSTRSPAALSPRSISLRWTLVSRAPCRRVFWPVTLLWDVKVHLTFGSYHEVDSSEMAFKIAGSMAFKEACRKADAILLEPVMKVSVIVPDEYLGNVIGDPTSRRGMIQGQESRPGATQVGCPWCPWPACSATPLTCAPPPRAAASTPRSPTAMWRSPRALPRRLSRSGAARTINFRPLAFRNKGIAFYPAMLYNIFALLWK